MFEAPPAATTSTLEADVDAAAKALAEVGRRLDRARKGLDALTRRGGLDELATLADAAKAVAVAAASVAAPELTQLAALGAALERHRADVLHARRGTFIGALRAQGRDQGVTVELLGDSPPTLLIAPLTCEVDLDKGEARLLFAHEPIATCELDASRVLAARSDAIAAIQADAAPSPAFFERLLAAWRVALTARGASPGDRVDLVDLLGPLALLSHPPARWRALAAKDLTPFPRHLLAYQLYRLRRDGLLEHAGQRLELGAATGGSARNKRDVLFVPTAPPEGQYYLSIRFAAR